MKAELRENYGPTYKLTLDSLQKLKDDGFQFVQVKGFTAGRRLDYMEPSFFVLLPIKELPDDVNKKGIYEPIHSSILSEWAKSPDDGIKVLVAKQ